MVLEAGFDLNNAWTLVPDRFQVTRKWRLKIPAVYSVLFQCYLTEAENELKNWFFGLGVVLEAGFDLNIAWTWVPDEFQVTKKWRLKIQVVYSVFYQGNLTQAKNSFFLAQKTAFSDFWGMDNQWGQLYNSFQTISNGT